MCAESGKLFEKKYLFLFYLKYKILEKNKFHIKVNKCDFYIESFMYFILHRHQKKKIFFIQNNSNNITAGLLKYKSCLLI